MPAERRESMVFDPRDPDWDAKVRDSFERQRVMGLLGAEIEHLEPGECRIGLAHREELTQQHGFFHAGVSSTIADSAGGYAAFSLFAPDTSVLSVEFKINLLAPADGDRLEAIGRVLRPGRTLTVCELEVLVHGEKGAVLCARGMQTVMCLVGRADTPPG